MAPSSIKNRITNTTFINIDRLFSQHLAATPLNLGPMQLGVCSSAHMRSTPLNFDSTI
jgi:hypothetical protein